MNGVQGTFSGLRILIVDDDSSVRFMLRVALEQAGFVVDEANDGGPALEQCRANCPDLILLDIMMPTVDGFTVCDQLRSMSEAGGHVPVLIMTGCDDGDSINRAYDVGATDFFTKPINYSLLIHRLRYMVRSKQMADQLRNSQARLIHAQKIARLGYWDWDKRQNKIAVSDQICKIFAIEWHGWIDFQVLLEQLHPEDRAWMVKAFASFDRNKEPYDLEFRIKGTSGEYRVIHTQGEVHYSDEGVAIEAAGTMQDITDRKRSEQEIRYLAYYDAVTGLPNRSFLVEHLKLTLENARRQQSPVALLFLDLDNFKRINDTLGHSAGDRLLRDVALRLHQCIRGGDALCTGSEGLFASELACQDDNAVVRLGGDEFVVMLTELVQVEDAAVVARRIIASLSLPFLLEGNEIVVTTSIGIGLFPADGEDADTLLKNADAAMYHTKALGKNGYQFFTAEITSRAMRKLEIEMDLRRALDEEELLVYYQPKVDIQRNRIVGMEALVRWQHPQRGLVSPAEFIPVAEETGLIESLGQVVLKLACCQLQAWQSTGLNGLRLSVNLSAAQFKNPYLGEQIRQTLLESGLQPRYLELELTESLLMESIDSSVNTMMSLKALGLEISIDDFGTGYSSLHYLTQFPLDTLKIDRAFVGNIGKGGNQAAIVKATIALAHSLQLKVVAEGIENQQQLDYLVANQCDEVQGFFFARPMPAEQFEAWVRTHERPMAPLAIAI